MDVSEHKARNLMELSSLAIVVSPNLYSLPMDLDNVDSATAIQVFPLVVPRPARLTDEILPGTSNGHALATLCPGIT